MIESVPEIVWALVVAVTIGAAAAIAAGRRGGQFRSLPGWGGFWLAFAALLVVLSRTDRRIGFVLLALVMFAALRAYFTVAPVRPRDRWAILAAYLSIPFALGPAYLGALPTFLATVPVALFLFIPVFLAIGTDQRGLLDSMGRTLLGVLFFVFCIAHLGLLVEPVMPLDGLPELFGLLAVTAELPQRLAGRSRDGWLRRVAGVAIGLVAATAVGWIAGPWCGLVEEDGARAGFLVAVAVSMGAQVTFAVVQDLELSQSSSLVGPGVLLTRTVPAIYAAPVFFHYLNHFA